MDRLGHRRLRHGLPILLALVAAVGLLAAPGTADEVRAASPDLTVVSSARYAVQPDRRRVRVTLDLTLKNHLTDTKTTRYYFDRAYLAVMPQASGYRLTWAGSGTPSVRATKRAKDYTIIRLDLARRLYSGNTARYTLRFDIIDKGGKATRDIRIGDSLVSFPVWAFASDATPGSSATVVFPSGFQVAVEAGKIPAPTVDAKGRTIYRTGSLSSPLTFYAFLVGDRPGAYTTTTITSTVAETPIEVTLRSWPEDKVWRKRVGGLIERALPVLGDSIGLAWPRTEPLVVQEAVSRSTGGYAGLFDPTRGLVEIAYYADDFVVLHEAAHAWFNGALLADRWANEAFASYYGLDAAKALKVKAKGDEMTAALEKSRIALNDWGAVGEPTATEDYAYAAALSLARLIAERAEADGLRAVWADAAARVGAYQPTGSAELVDGPPDWRGFLDLLEARTGKDYTDLWTTWVARETDLPLIAARAAARTRYDAVVASAGAWLLPRAIRDAMRAWRFEDATTLLDQADAALTHRTAVERAAKAAGLATPVGLRAAFEDDDGFADVALEADAEMAAIDRYMEAVASRSAGGAPFAGLGLLDETPEADLVSARVAFDRGDLEASIAAAGQAEAAWSGAAALGQGRAISLVVLLLSGLLGASLIILWTRGRRRRRIHRMQAHRIRD